MDYNTDANAGGRASGSAPAFIQSYMDSIPQAAKDAAGPLFKDAPIQASKLLAGSSQTIIIVLVIVIGVYAIVNGIDVDKLLDFAKWVVGGSTATGVAYMVKSGVENKAKIEKVPEKAPDPVQKSDPEYILVNPEEHDL